MILITHAATISTANREMLDDVRYPQYVNWMPETYTNVKSGMVYPPYVLIDKCMSSIDKAAVNSVKCKTAVLYAAGSSMLCGAHDTEYNSRLTYVYRVRPMLLTNVFAGKCAGSFEWVEYVASDASACASSLKCLSDAVDLMRHRGFGRVVIVACEDQVSDSVLATFGSLGVTRNVPIPSAFDEVNVGFSVGQGAAVVVLEKPEFATGEPIAEVRGAGVFYEYSKSGIGQDEAGSGFTGAMREAVRSAGVAPEDISVVKTHGTGTVSNNLAEKRAITQMFTNFVATSYKPTIGHTMGVSGVLESVELVKSLRSGVVPKIANRTSRDDVFLSEDTRSPSSGYMIANAAGMGGTYASAVIDWRV